MILTVLLIRAASKAKGRTPEECAPGGERPWGAKEATWDGSKWTAVPPLEMYEMDLPVMSDDYQVEVGTPPVACWASTINRALVEG